MGWVVVKGCGSGVVVRVVMVAVVLVGEKVVMQ